MKKSDIYYFRYQINKKMAEEEWIKFYYTNDSIHICYKKRYETNCHHFLVLWYKEKEKDQPVIKKKSIPIQLKLFKL